MVNSFNSLLVLVMMVAVLSNALTGSQAHCVPSTKVPTGRNLWSRLLSTSTGHVLANVAGYLRLYGDQFTVDTYLPLRLNQADDLFKSSHDNFNNHELTLAGECVILTLNYTRAGPSVIYHELKMHVRIEEENVKARAKWKQPCDFSPKLAFVHPKERHYSCVHKQAHACFRDDGEPVAELVLERLKLETNVRPDLFEDGTFDKVPLEESCSYW